MIDRLSSTISRSWKRVSSIRNNRLEVAFDAFVLIIFGVSLLLGSTYESTSRLFPIVVGTISFGLMILVLAMGFSSRLQKLGRKYTVDSLSNFGDRSVSEEEPRSTGSNISQSKKRTNLVEMIAWTISLVITIYVLGYFLGTIAFLVLVYRFQANTSWPRTILYSVAIWVSIIMIFFIVLNAPLYNGLIGVSFPM